MSDDVKRMEKRLEEMRLELEDERACRKDAERWIDILFDNLEMAVQDMKGIDERLRDAETKLIRGDNMAAGYEVAKAMYRMGNVLDRWDYEGRYSTLRKLREACGYEYVDGQGWMPSGVCEAYEDGFVYPEHPRKVRK